MEDLIKILTACAPILVALVGIIPTIISNRKKTEKSIQESNEAIKKEVTTVKADMDSVRMTLVDHIGEADDERARTQRYRILRFYDEMCEHRKHSESHFEDILDDIDEYEVYCEKHPEFKNNRGKAAMEYIKAEYPKIKANGGFLTHPPEDHDQ